MAKNQPEIPINNNNNNNIKSPLLLMTEDRIYVYYQYFIVFYNTHRKCATTKIILFVSLKAQTHKEECEFYDIYCLTANVRIRFKFKIKIYDFIFKAYENMLYSYY